MTQPRILVILLNFRTATMCMKAADAAVVAMRGLDAEMVIVDNDSGDGSYEALREHVAQQGWSQVRVVQSGRNGGFGAGNNVGMRAGRNDGTVADYIYILNSDAFPEPDALRKLVAWCEAHPDTGIAGSHILGEDGTSHPTAFRFPSIAGDFENAVRFGPITRLLRHSRVPMELPDAPQGVDWLAGASMLMRREMLDRIGSFDETFFLYFEETDLCLRARRAGWQVVYIPESRVTHVGSVSTGMRRWTRIPQYWLDSRWHYFTKNHGTGYAVLVTCAHVGGALLWRLRRLVQTKPRVDPPHFLRDLIRHDLRALFRAAPAHPPGVPPEPARRLP